MQIITKDTENAVNEITATWHKSIDSLLDTAQLLLKHSLNNNWQYIQKELAERNIMKSSVISMMLGIAQNNALNNPKNRNSLPPAYNTLYHISQLSEDVIESRINEGDITASVKLDEVRAWKTMEKITSNVKKVKDISLIRITSDDLSAHKVELLPELIAFNAKFPYLKIEGV